MSLIAPTTLTAITIVTVFIIRTTVIVVPRGEGARRHGYGDNSEKEEAGKVHLVLLNIGVEGENLRMNERKVATSKPM
jgi:hypothetical protein